MSSETGGWYTRTNITLTIGPRDKVKNIQCHAVNQEIGETRVESHTINVLCKYLCIFLYLKHARYLTDPPSLLKMVSMLVFLLFSSSKHPFSLIYIFFSLIVFGGTEVPIVYIFPLPPLRGQPTAKCHPRWQPIRTVFFLV